MSIIELRSLMNKLTIYVEMSRGRFKTAFWEGEAPAEPRFPSAADRREPRRPCFKTTSSRVLLVLVFCIIASFATASTCCALTEQDEASESVQDSEVKTDFLGDPLPQHALIRLGTNRFNPSRAAGVALSADDSIAVTLGSGTLMAWDAKTGKLLWEKPTGIPRGNWSGAAEYGSQPIYRLPISGRLAISGLPGSIDFWDFESGEKTTLSTETTEQFKSIDVSPDETLIALGGQKFLLVCDLTGKEKYRIENHPEKSIARQIQSDRLSFGGEFSYGRFTPDGKLLALVNSESPKTIQVLDAQSGEVKRKIETTGRIVRIDFAPDSRQIATTERDIAARLYDLETGEMVWENVFSVPGMDERYTTDVQFSPTGNLVAVGTAIGEDQRIQLLDPKNGEAIGDLKGHTWKPWCLRFTRDGEQMYSTGWDGVIRRWDIEKREQVRIENSERASGVCSMAPNGKTAAFCDDTGKLHIIDVVSGKKLKKFEFPGTGFTQIIYSQDCQRLAAGGSSKNDIHVYVWNLETGEIMHHWEWPKGRDIHSSVEALSFSKDASRIAAGVFRQSACYVFDLPTDKQIAKVRHGNIYGLCLSPDGSQLVSAGWDKSIRLWDCETGQSLNDVAVTDPDNVRGDTRMYGVLFSPDGKTIASLEMDSKIRIWTAELEPITKFKLESRVVYGSFQFSRNGLWLGVGCMSGKGYVYDVQTGEVVWDAAKHGKYIYNVDFGADDRTILTGGEDGVCYLWNLNVAPTDGDDDFEKLAKDLLGESPRDAFVAHQRLAADPERALPAIRAAVEPMSAQRAELPDETEMNKLLGDLDSDDEATRMTALEALVELGLSAYRAISEATADETNSETKAAMLKRILDEYDEFHSRIRRVAFLLAELEQPGADTLLDDMLKNSPNLAIKKTIFLARRHRDQFLKRLGKSGSK